MAKYTQLGGMFWKSDTAVFCEWKPLKLDPATTRVAHHAWAVDDKRVFHKVFFCRKIEASSFVGLNALYGKDDYGCYFETQAIKNAEPTTFEVLDSGLEKRMFLLGTNHDAGYAKDRSHVYFDGKKVKNADPMSFVSVGNCYGRDANSVFYDRFRLNRAKPISWRYIGGRYSRDNARVYYENRIVKNAQLEMFQHIRPFDEQFAYDGCTFFYRGEPTTTEYYVDCLHRESKHIRDFAEIVENGTWQNNFHKRTWHYRAPDEILASFSNVRVGDTMSTIRKTLWGGESVSRSHWDFFFPPLNELIRAGLSEAAGTVPWSQREAHTPPNCEVYRWSHPEKVLVCSFVDNVVVAKVILDTEHASPPPAH